jgi:hypothetical protein
MVDLDLLSWNFDFSRKTSMAIIIGKQSPNVQQQPNSDFCLYWILNISTPVDGYKPNLILWLDFTHPQTPCKIQM